MQYVPTVLPMRTDIGKTEGRPPVEAVRPAMRVTARSEPPFIYQRRRAMWQGESSGEANEEGLIERHGEAKERRYMCRRVDRMPVTLDTRSGHDRRRDARRKQDHLASSVDIQA